MRLAERQKIAFEKAKAIMDADDFAALSAALVSGAPVRFTYTDRYGDEKKYKNVHPLSFFETPQDADWAGSVLLWSRHEIHSKKEQYRVERIFDVKWIITLLDALLDPSTNAEFWAGGTSADAGDTYSDRQTIDVNGVEIVYNSATSSVADTVSAILSGGTFPSALLDVIKKVHINEDFYGLDPTLQAEFDDGTIVFYGTHVVNIHLLAHEAGHGFALNKWGDLEPPEDSDFVKAFRSGEPLISDYSHNIISEDFAEAVGLYVSDPARLKEMAPRKYEAVKKLLGG